MLDVVRSSVPAFVEPGDEFHGAAVENYARVTSGGIRQASLNRTINAPLATSLLHARAGARIVHRTEVVWIFDVSFPKASIDRPALP